MSTVYAKLYTLTTKMYTVFKVQFQALEMGEWTVVWMVMGWGIVGD